MGLMSFLNLEGPDIAAFFAATLLGYLAGAMVPAGSWSIYVSILVSYHLFLAWLIFSTEQKTGASLTIASTIITHLACLAVVIPLGMDAATSPTSESSVTPSPPSPSLNADGSSAAGQANPNPNTK